MTYKQFHDLRLRAGDCDDLDHFIAECGDAGLEEFGERDDDAVVLRALTDVWTMAKDFRFATLKDMCGLTNVKFAERYNLSRRTVEDWKSGKGNPGALLLDLLSADVITEMNKI